MNKNRRFFLIGTGSFAVSLLLSSQQRVATSATLLAQRSPNALKVGVNPVPHGEILAFVQKNLATAAGLNLEIINFDDYVQPNVALNDKQIGANYFQHVPYMENYNKERGTNIVAVVSVHIEPLGVYSKRVKSLPQVADRATVSIPNDAVNQGRALKLLQDRQLIKLKDKVGVNATVRDIAQNSKKLKFAELDAAQLPRSLDDVDLAVINGNYALQIGLKPNKDALALESAKGNPYANVLSVLQGEEKDPNIQTLAKLLTSPQVKKFITDKYQGAVIPAF